MNIASAVLIPLLLAASDKWVPQRLSAPGENVAGAAAVRGDSVVSWGDTLRIWDLRRMTSGSVARGPFGEGACAFGDSVVTVRGQGLGDLLAIRISDGSTEHLDSQVEMHDCLEATLLGRRGVLVIQRGIQVRFYERVAPGKWISRDIYSIYTPSYQTGLALGDVDGDGRTDIFCGNYWIRSPERFEESWRLFAINTWFEGPQSASLRIVSLGPRRVVAAQAHLSPARFAQFDAPANPELLWPATPLVPDLKLSRIHALASIAGELIAAENSGPGSRIIQVKTGKVIGTNGGSTSLVPLADGSFVTAGPDGVVVWRLTREASRP